MKAAHCSCQPTTLSPCPAVVTAPRNTAVIPVVLDYGRHDLKKKSIGYVFSPAFAQIFTYALQIALSRKASRAIVAAKKIATFGAIHALLRQECLFRIRRSHSLQTFFSIRKFSLIALVTKASSNLRTPRITILSITAFFHTIAHTCIEFRLRIPACADSLSRAKKRFSRKRAAQHSKLLFLT